MAQLALTTTDAMTEYRCGNCRKLLLEFTNDVRLGAAIVVKHCEKCKKRNVLELKPR